MRERKQEAVERAREDAAKDPGTTTPMGAEAVLALQRSAGNAAVARLIGGHRVPKPAKPRPRIGGHRPAKPAAQNPYDPLPVENAYLPAIQAVAGGGSSEEAIAAAGH